MKKQVIILLFFFVADRAVAATVDTVTVYSKAMHAGFKCVVIKPQSYKKGSTTSFPVVYLLHGWSGAYTDWINKVPVLKDYADKLDIMIVCPEGGYSSWYFDSPVDSAIRYETFIASEVPQFVDGHYRTKKNRRFRAITGLSMGGHGAFFIAFRHPGFFGACGSMSGAVELNAMKTKYDIMKRIGDTVTNAANWVNYSVDHIIENYPKDSLRIIFDCGTDDPFYKINHALHEKMLQLNIPHDYIERPGGHNWPYWYNAVKYQLLFFRDYFNQ